MPLSFSPTVILVRVIGQWVLSIRYIRVVSIQKLNIGAILEQFICMWTAESILCRKCFGRFWHFVFNRCQLSTSAFLERPEISTGRECVEGISSCELQSPRGTQVESSPGWCCVPERQSEDYPPVFRELQHAVVLCTHLRKGRDQLWQFFCAHGRLQPNKAAIDLSHTSSLDRPEADFGRRRRLAVDCSWPCVRNINPDAADDDCAHACFFKHISAGPASWGNREETTCHTWLWAGVYASRNLGQTQGEWGSVSGTPTASEGRLLPSPSPSFRDTCGRGKYQPYVSITHYILLICNS